NNPYGIVYTTTLNNEHNHELSPSRMKFFNDNEFTQEMDERVKFYLNVVKLKPLQIQKALQKEFPDREIHLYEIYKQLRNISLVELAEVLEVSISEEYKKAQYVYWKTQIPLTSSVVTLPQALFPEVDNSIITKDELIEYQE
ncbi:8170_t:CDS:2, partial [Gigaspora rosea]